MPQKDPCQKQACEIQKCLQGSMLNAFLYFSTLSELTTRDQFFFLSANDMSSSQM